MFHHTFVSGYVIGKNRTFSAEKKFGESHDRDGQVPIGLKGRSKS